MASDIFATSSLRIVSFIRAASPNLETPRGTTLKPSEATSRIAAGRGIPARPAFPLPTVSAQGASPVRLEVWRYIHYPAANHSERVLKNFLHRIGPMANIRLALEEDDRNMVFSCAGFCDCYSRMAPGSGRALEGADDDVCWRMRNIQRVDALAMQFLLMALEAFHRHRNCSPVAICLVVVDRHGPGIVDVAPFANPQSSRTHGHRFRWKRIFDTGDDQIGRLGQRQNLS